MKHDVKLRVRNVRRESSRVGSTITIIADCLEETPHLGVMKVRVDSMVEMEKLLRQAIGPDTDPNRSILKGVRWFDQACALLDEIDKADLDREPGPPVNPWDQLDIEGAIAPAHCRIRFENPASQTQIKGVAIGYSPRQFDVELLVMPENVAACEEFVARLWPYKPGGGADLVFYRMHHPALALLGIQRVAIIGLRSGEGPEPGTVLFVLRAVEYFPKRSAT